MKTAKRRAPSRASAPGKKPRSRRAWVLLARVPVRAPVSPIVRLDDEPTQETDLPRRHGDGERSA